MTGPEAPAELARLRACLDALLEAGVSLALFREQDGEPRLVLQPDGGSSVVPRLSGLDGRGFLLAPFAVSPKTPIVFIRDAGPVRGWPAILAALERFAAGRSIAVPDAGPADGAGEAAPADCPGLGSTPTESYRHAFNAFLEDLRRHRFHKLVLSREQAIPGTFSPAAAFLRACEAYPDAMVSLTHSPASGTWIGASPEVLAAGSGGRWRTMALAGTRAVDERGRWDDKNLEEQALVADYIRGRLSRFCDDVHERGPYTVRAGRLCHLRTDFSFVPESLADTAAIVEGLHPTPAVCGLPKDEARMFIRNTEDHERRYYAGFLGWWGGCAEAALYVNLRCMEMTPDRAVLHAGGGILPASLLDSEWRETCNKMGTMLSLLRAGA